MAPGTGKSTRGKARGAARGAVAAIPRRGSKPAPPPPKADLTHVHLHVDRALHMKVKVYAVTYQISMQDLAIEGLTDLLAKDPDLGEVDPKKPKDVAVHFAVPSDLHKKARVFAALREVTLRHLIIRGLQLRLEKGKG